MFAVSPFKKRLRRANVNQVNEDEVIIISDSDESVELKSPSDHILSDSDSESVELVKYCPLKFLDVNQLNAFLKGTPSYYNNDKEMPVLEKLTMERKRLYSVEDIVKLLLHPDLKHSKFVATKVPTMISNSVSFIVNLDRLEVPDDILSDDMGVWKNNGTDKTYVNVTFEDSAVRKVMKSSPKDVQSINTYMVKRVYRIHGTDKSLRKTTAFIYDTSNEMSCLALVIYKFDGLQDHAVLVRPHGNAKKGKGPYRRTKESTKNLLKAELEHSSPKFATNKVFENKGGIILAESAGDLPRDRMQAYNLKRKQQELKISSTFSTSSYSHCNTRDMLYVVMEQCKCAEKGDKFVQDVTCAPEPMAVLCCEQQLNDLVRFCCDPFEFCVLGIDPTFNLGEFSVTPVVYRHLLVKNAAGRSPLMVGPMLVHHRKEFRSYNYFLSTLIGLNQRAATVKAIGTDGEKTLVDAVLRNFPEAAHVRCFRHLQQNVEMHLREQQFPQDTIREYIHDIFGWTETSGLYHEGLVDCSDISAFDRALQTLKERWNQLESNAFNDRKSHKSTFHDWFLKQKAEDFRYCTLRSLREDIGLGSPPTAFYTNDNEAINAKLKECLGYKKHQWALFNAKMKEMVNQQQQEVQKAIIGYGQYRLRSQYSSLAVTEEKWFRMSQEQRQRCINKFNAATVSQMVSSEKPDAARICSPAITNVSTNYSESSSQSTNQDITIGRFGATTSDLSLSLSDAMVQIKLPYTTVEGIWKKAASLVAEANAIVPAPGFDAKDKMVKSKSGSAPHLVRVCEHRYKCDDRCPQFKSINMCSHVVAAAESNGDLLSFVKWFRTKCGSGPNLMQMATHDMPAGAGRKNGKAAKKKAKPKQLPSDDDRVPLLSSSSAAMPPHHGGESSGTPYNAVNHAIQPQTQIQPPATIQPPTMIQPPAMIQPPTVIHSPTTIQPPAVIQPPSVVQSPTIVQSPYQYQSTHHTLVPWMYPSIHLPSAPYPYHLTNPLHPTVSPLNPSNSSTFSTHGSPHQTHDTSSCYKVCFKVGNISVCNGCRKLFTDYDLVVIQHAEFRHYTNPQTGLPASKFGNAYYHPKKACIELKWGATFHTSNLVIPDGIRGKLTITQKEQLQQEFAVLL